MRNSFIVYLVILLDRIAFYLFFQWYYRRRFRHYGKNIRWGRYYRRLTIPGNIRISCPEKISIGDNCQFDEFTHLMCHHDGDGLFIGNNVRCANGFTHILAFSKLVIEDNVLIGAFVHINNGNHGYAGNEIPIMDQPYVRSGEIRISTGSWIGRNAHVLGGVTIGRNCVVAANAVVTKDAPDYCVVGGIPARVLKV